MWGISAERGSALCGSASASSSDAPAALEDEREEHWRSETIRAGCLAFFACGIWYYRRDQSPEAMVGILVLLLSLVYTFTYDAV